MEVRKVEMGIKDRARVNKMQKKGKKEKGFLK